MAGVAGSTSLHVEQVGDDRYRVTDPAGSGTPHAVDLSAVPATCDCADHAYRRRVCKHIKAAQHSRRPVSTELRVEPRRHDPTAIADAAERAVLSAILLAEAVPPPIAAMLEVRMFHRDANGLLFGAMLALSTRGRAVDPITLAAALNGQLDQVGGMAYVADLIDQVPTAAHIEHHARIVREHSLRRDLARAGAALADASLSPEQLAATVHQVEELQQALAGDATPAAFRLLDDVEIEGEPDAASLVEGILLADSLGVVYGASGAFKTFAALDVALSIASGQPWRGRAVQQGPVAYIVAEGWSGIRRRVQAWKTARGFSGRAGVHFFSGSVNLMDRVAVERLLAAIQEKLGTAPVLVIFDTLNQSMPGGDENASQDMGLVIANVQHVRRATGATVLLVHHCRRQDEEERGHGSLRNAADTMLQLAVGDDDACVLTCTKQRNAAYFEPLRFSMVPVGESLVLADPLARGHGPGQPLTKRQEQALAALRDIATDDGVPYGRWEEASGLKPRTFAVAVKALVESGRAAKTGTGRAGRYRIGGDDALPF